MHFAHENFKMLMLFAVIIGIDFVANEDDMMKYLKGKPHLGFAVEVYAALSWII